MEPIFKEYDIPIYRGKFIILFSDKNEKIEAFCIDDKQDFKLEYAHTFIVNYKQHEAFLIAFKLKNPNELALKLTELDILDIVTVSENLYVDTDDKLVVL